MSSTALQQHSPSQQSCCSAPCCSTAWPATSSCSFLCQALPAVRQRTAGFPSAYLKNFSYCKGLRPGRKLELYSPRGSQQPQRCKARKCSCLLPICTPAPSKHWQAPLSQLISVPRKPLFPDIARSPCPCFNPTPTPKG